MKRLKVSLQYSELGTDTYILHFSKEISLSKHNKYYLSIEVKSNPISLYY